MPASSLEQILGACGSCCQCRFKTGEMVLSVWTSFSTGFGYRWQPQVDIKLGLPANRSRENSFSKIYQISTHITGCPASRKMHAEHNQLTSESHSCQPIVIANLQQQQQPPNRLPTPPFLCTYSIMLQSNKKKRLKPSGRI